MEKIILLFILNGFADWETSFITPALVNYGNYEVKTVSITTAPVKSMGGLTIIPDYSLTELNLEHVEALILPGAESWLNENYDELAELIEQCLEKNILIAAICGATVHLGKHGFLDNRPHTSNSTDFLINYCPSYTGVSLYKNIQAINGNGIITANVTASLEFSKEILLALNVLPKNRIDEWYNQFKHGLE